MTAEAALVTAATFRTRAEAEIAAALLGGENIPHIIQSAEGMAHGPMVDGTRLLVREDHLPEALRVLGYPRLVQDDDA